MDHLTLPRNSTSEPNAPTLRTCGVLQEHLHADLTDALERLSPSQNIIDGLRIEVPYLCTEPYDDGPIETYPERQGWKLTPQSRQTQYPFLHNGAPPERIVDVVAFLQNWFYFGLLHEALGSMPSFSHSLFILNTNGKRYITTKALEQLVEDWIAQLIHTTDREDAIKRIQKLANTMNNMHVRVVMNVFWKGDAAENSLFCADGKSLLWVMISVSALAEYLNCAMSFVAKVIDSENLALTDWTFGHLGILQGYFLLRLGAVGWCPSEVAKIKKECSSLSILYYLSELHPPRPGKDHSTCTEELCNIIHASENGYQLVHTSDACACDTLPVNLSEVEFILKNENLPLVTVSPEGEKLSLHERNNKSENVEFVAISHVWADGKGNPENNALPRCVLHHLQSMVNNLPRSKTCEPMPFWIDTLLIPIKPKELRDLAVKNMREAYKNAKQVLVLDAYLQRLNTSALVTNTDGAIEIFTRVFHCPWNRRLWTMQEGSLAKKLWFQFSDKAVDLNELFAKTILSQRLMKTMSASFIMRNYVFLQWRGARYHPNPDLDSSPRWKVGLLRKSFVGRAVSKPEDEGICLFCRAGLDMKEVVEANGSERVRLFWSRIDEAPASILFAMVPHRLKHKGLRWAPTSFLQPAFPFSEWLHPGVTLEQGRIDSCKTTARGLRVSLPGFVFNHLRVDPGEPHDKFLRKDSDWFYFRDTLGVWYDVSLEVSRSNGWSDRTFDFPTPRKITLILGTDESEIGGNFKQGLLALVEATDATSTEDDMAEFHAIPFMHVMIRKAVDGLQALYPVYQRCAQQVLNHKPDVSNISGSNKDYIEEVIERTMDEVGGINRRSGLFFEDQPLDEIRKKFVEGVQSLVALENKNEAERLDKGQIWYVD